MRRIEVNPGDRFGDLEVIKEVEGNGKRRFLCRCDCERQVEVRLGHLRSGHSMSCGNCGIKYGADRLTVRGWAERYGIKESTLRARLKIMPIREALKRK